MPPHEQAQRDTAQALGYGDDAAAVACMNALHDPYHDVVAGLLGLGWSPTLYWAETGQPAHPTRSEDAIGAEETLVLGLQEWMQTGRFNGAIRILWLLGHDPEAVRLQLQNAVVGLA